MPSACEPIAPFKITNQTDRVLTIFISGYEIGEVMPGEELENENVLMHEMRDGKYHIEARDKEGKLVYSKKFPYEEMPDIDWKITISPTSDNCTITE